MADHHHNAGPSKKRTHAVMIGAEETGDNHEDVSTILLILATLLTSNLRPLALRPLSPPPTPTALSLIPTSSSLISPTSLPQLPSLPEKTLLTTP